MRERGTSALRTRLGRAPRSVAISAAAVASALAIVACGGSEPRQDVGEPSGEFPVSVYKSSFPNRQRLAEATDLVLGVENSGEKTIPDLAVTIFVDQGASQPFYIRVDDPGLANPNRPVWILENKYPLVKGEPRPEGSSPGTVAQTNTFAFGELEPGDRREMIWHVTPVRAGTYTVNYEVSAGLYGKAEAVTSDGSAPEGKFVVTISDKPPQATVNEAGKVEIEE